MASPKSILEVGSLAVAAFSLAFGALQLRWGEQANRQERAMHMADMLITERGKEITLALDAAYSDWKNAGGDPADWARFTTALYGVDPGFTWAVDWLDMYSTALNHCLDDGHCDKQITKALLCQMLSDRKLVLQGLIENRQKNDENFGAGLTKFAVRCSS